MFLPSCPEFETANFQGINRNEQYCSFHETSR